MAEAQETFTQDVSLKEEAPVIADIKYGQLDKSIVDLLTDLERTHFREDKPVDFCGLKVYPVQVRDFEAFSACTSCLTLNKNEDKDGLRLSHLDYLLSRTQLEKEGQMWSYKIQRLCELVFHIQNGLKCSKCGRIISYDSPEFKDFLSQVRKALVALDKKENAGEEAENSEENAPPSLHCPECDGTEFTEMIKIVKDENSKKLSLSIDGHLINSKDFTVLRQLILYQNFYDYVDDSWVDPEVKRDHDERVRMEQERNDLHASIEKKVVCLAISTHYTCEEIYDMSIRRFTLALATVDDLINYKIMKQSVMSGFVSLPKGKNVEHWIYKPNKDMYGDAYKSTDQIQSDVSNL